MRLYREAGAKYFVSRGVHCDNFDLWNSRRRWNSVKMGPKRDIVAEWREAARAEGLRFGVSEHVWGSYTGVRGATVDVIYTERLAPDRQHLQQFSWYPVGDRVLCTLDEISWMPAGPRGARYCLLTVRKPRQDVTLHSFDLRSTNFPAQRRGRFRCSDPVLTEVWRMCERTQAANMEDAFIDCAGRERGMYIRDTIIQYHVNLAIFGYHRLMRRCLELFGQSADATGRFRIVYPNTGAYTYNDFSLNMVEGYRAYYDATGDDARIEADWPAIRTNLEYFH